VARGGRELIIEDSRCGRRSNDGKTPNSSKLWERSDRAGKETCAPREEKKEGSEFSQVVANKLRRKET